MSDAASPDLPNLSFSVEVAAAQISLHLLQSLQDPLAYPWKFTTCAEFCEEFGIRNKTLLIAVFEKIKKLGISEQNPQVFERLYSDVSTPEFIKKIMVFPEFGQYLATQNADHCLSLLSKRIETCAQYKKKLAYIVSLFKSQPIEACLALIRFTHSAETLPEGEEKNQLRWLLGQTRQAWYKENYLIRHALTSPFLQTYLNTHPQWTPCIDFILTLSKEQKNLSPENWKALLSLAHFNTPLFCEAMSQAAIIHTLDLNLLTPFLSTHPNALEDFLKLSQHHEQRFLAWAAWLKIMPSNAPLIFSYWQNHLSHLTVESDCSKNALQDLLEAMNLGNLVLDPLSIQLLEKLIESTRVLSKPILTNREKDKLPDKKRYLLTEMVLLCSVKFACSYLSFGLIEATIAGEFYNRKIAPCLNKAKLPETGFDNVCYAAYASVGKPLSGNRIFEYTAEESFKKTFLNGFKLFTDRKVGKQYYEHLRNPKMTDAEFYERVLARP
jgi:hypothetical protein